MTVTRETTRWVYNGDGATTTFVYDNVIYAETDLEVFIGGTQQTTGYTVTGVGNPAGGTVVFDTAPPAGTANVILQSAIPQQQVTAIDKVSKLPSEAIETMVDRNTRLVQQINDIASRALRLGAGDDTPGDAMIIPDRTTRANKVQAYDAQGLPIAGELGDPGTLIVGATGKALIATGTPAAARETIGAAAQTELTALNAHTAAFLTPGLIRQRVNNDDLSPAWLPMDGRTVGSVASNADHANDGFQAAFAALWNGVRSHVKIFDSAGVETTYGANADDDWALNKRIALLDDRGRAYIGAGQGTTPVNLTLRQLGEALGVEDVTLTAAQSGLPAHNHPFNGPGNTAQFQGGAGANAFIDTTAQNTSNNSAQDAAQAHTNMQPSRAIHYEMWTGVTAGTAPLDLTSLGFTWNGDWADSTAYVVGDCVRGSSGAYVCKSPHTGPGDGSTRPETGANWLQYWDLYAADATGGGGDMMKSVYDGNDDAVVNAADTLAPQVRAGEALLVGDLVAMDSFSGGLVNVKKASATDFEEAYGIMMAPAANGEAVNPARSTFVTGVNTAGQTLGAPVFLKDGGGWQFTQPTTTMIQVVGWIAHVGTTDGVILFEPQPRSPGKVLVTFTAGTTQTVSHNTLYTPIWQEVLEDTLGVTQAQIFPNTLLVLPTKPFVRCVVPSASIQISDNVGGAQRYIEVTNSVGYGHGRFRIDAPGAATFQYLQVSGSAVTQSAGQAYQVGVFQDSGGDLTIGGSGTLNQRLTHLQLVEV